MKTNKEIKDSNLKYAQDKINEACAKRNQKKAFLAAKLWVKIKYAEIFKK